MRVRWGNTRHKWASSALSVGVAIGVYVVIGGCDSRNPNRGSTPEGGTCHVYEDCQGALDCCSGICVPVNDTNNCGGCGGKCNPNETCEQGRCSCGGSLETCAANELCCGNVGEETCVAITDPNNCGACGNACPSGIPCCSAGGAAHCATDDPMNCGACGAVCGIGQDCCNGTCANDVTDCGKCGIACPAGQECCETLGGTECCDPDAGVDASVDATTDAVSQDASQDGAQDATRDATQDAGSDVATQDAAQEAEAGPCLGLGAGCQQGGESCCSGLSCPSTATQTLACCVTTQQSCTNSNECCLAEIFPNSPGGVYCGSSGKCCGRIPSESGLGNAPCNTAADCCSGPCTPYYPQPDAGGPPGFCCQPYQAACTPNGNRGDCCDGIAGCNPHAGYTGARCCIVDGAMSEQCTQSWIGDNGCCSGHCDSNGSGYCCTPPGNPCDANSGCCEALGHTLTCGSNGQCCTASSVACDANTPCCPGMQCQGGTCCENAGQLCDEYHVCCGGLTCNPQTGTCG